MRGDQERERCWKHGPEGLPTFSDPENVYIGLTKWLP